MSEWSSRCEGSGVEGHCLDRFSGSVNKRCPRWPPGVLCIYGLREKYLEQYEQAEQSGVPGPVTAGDVVIATDGHPFWVPDLEQWVDAIDLAPGMWLQTSSGTWVQVSAVQSWTQAATVHNLTVQGVHTFHVAAGGLDVLNHNCGGARFSTDGDGKITDLSNPASTERNPLQGTSLTSGKSKIRFSSEMIMEFQRRLIPYQPWKALPLLRVGVEYLVCMSSCLGVSMEKGALFTGL
ncbi:hypothetical protein CQJ94_09950 [Glycomyces fuscus]|nr:hypothetical protein CQJ94_09950 [Glycomyces fuscus]